VHEAPQQRRACARRPRAGARRQRVTDCGVARSGRRGLYAISLHIYALLPWHRGARLLRGIDARLCGLSARLCGLRGFARRERPIAYADGAEDVDVGADAHYLVELIALIDADAVKEPGIPDYEHSLLRLHLGRGLGHRILLHGRIIRHGGIGGRRGRRHAIIGDVERRIAEHLDHANVQQACLAPVKGLGIDRIDEGRHAGDRSFVDRLDRVDAIRRAGREKWYEGN
jgi:hypothetical protein